MAPVSVPTPKRPDITVTALTERGAVLQALDECDRLGRERFLETHGFRHALRYFIRHNGRLYDSKAIAGVALGYQHGSANELRSGYFTGGKHTAVRVLRRLGFEVIDTGTDSVAPVQDPPLDRPLTPGDLNPGHIYSWDDLAAAFGFRPRYFSVGGGMLASNEHDALLLITHPRDTDSSIYRDKWDEATGELIYTGKGPLGPQALERENLDAAENRRALYLFEQAGSERLLFHGPVRCTEWWPDIAPDTAGQLRRVYRFRLTLRTQGARPRTRSHRGSHALAAEQLRRPRPFDPTKPPSGYRPSAEIKTSPDEAAALHEKALQGHHQILSALSDALAAAAFTDIDEIPGATDLQAQRAGKTVLFEAKTLTVKSESARVRGGLAQLLEYRFLHGKPNDDLCLVGNAPIAGKRVRLLHALGIDYIWLDSGRFHAPAEPLSSLVSSLISQQSARTNTQ